MSDTTKATKTHFLRIVCESDLYRAVLRSPRDTKDESARSIIIESKSLDAMNEARWTRITEYEENGECCVEGAVFDLLANGTNPNDPD